MAEAVEHQLDLRWFYLQVRNGGRFDYKQEGKAFLDPRASGERKVINPFEDASNFNFGAVGRAAGIPAPILRRGAGLAQWVSGTSKPEWGGGAGFFPWAFGRPYGDDPIDQDFIDAGIAYADCTAQ